MSEENDLSRNDLELRLTHEKFISYYQACYHINFIAQ